MKMVNSSVARAVRFALFSSASLFALGIGAVQAEEEASDSAEEEESIVITGSRIRREGYETPAPTMVIDAEQIKNTGAISLGEALNELPQLRNTFSLSNSGRFIGTAGGGFLDLRGLGSERTLVLINGRRHVAASEGSSEVDVNSIPSHMIEKVEVLTGANSAVYGADAVSGVVNIILKSDYVGTQIDVDYGKAEDSGFNKKSLSITKGFNFAEDKGNAIISVGYAHQDRLTASERGGFFNENWGLVSNPADGDEAILDDDGNLQFTRDDGIPDEIYQPNAGRWTIVPGGVIQPLRAYFRPDGSLVYYDDLPDVQFDTRDASVCYGPGCNSLNTLSSSDLQVGFQSFTLDANFNFDLADDHTFFWESRYAEVEGLQSSTASFDFGGITIRRDNAYASNDLIEAMNTAGVNSFGVNRLNDDLGRRMEDNTRQTFRIVAGVEGYLTDYWEYSTSINWGKTDVRRVNKNNRIDDHWHAAYDAVRLTAADVAAINDTENGGNPNLLPGATAGQIVCRSRLDAASGRTPILTTGTPAGLTTYQNCVPVNVLGFGNITQEARDYINSTALGFATIEQTQFQAAITNSELVELPAGPLGFVFGVEYRQEESSSSEDSLSALGGSFFNAIATTSARFDVSEYFTETVIPLVADVPFIESLDLEFAARYSDYSTIGDTVTWESRLNWSVNSEFRIRATHGEAIRAPSISTLFSPAGENFSTYNDPCDAQNVASSSTPATRIANCQALGIADPQNFTAQDDSSTPLLSGGNPNVEEETATSTTIGFVYSPDFLPNFNIAVDYWEVTIEDAIASTAVQSILDRCVDSTAGIDNQFCALVTRGSDGNVLQVRDFPLNLNVLESSGYEFEMDYRIDMGIAGTLRPRLTGSYLADRTFLLNSQDDVDIVDGELGDPKLEMRLGLNWEYDNVGAFLELRYLGEQYLVEQETLVASSSRPDPNPDSEEIIEVGAEYVMDIGANYTFANGLKMGFLIDNALDTDPPFPLTGTGAGSGIYPNYGRFFSVNASWEF